MVHPDSHFLKYLGWYQAAYMPDAFQNTPENLNIKLLFSLKAILFVQILSLKNDNVVKIACIYMFALRHFQHF